MEVPVITWEKLTSVSVLLDSPANTVQTVGVGDIFCPFCTEFLFCQSFMLLIFHGSKNFSIVSNCVFADNF